MSGYDQGRRVEYAVTAHLRDNGYEIQRAASSKGIADVIAIKEGQILLCSVKRTTMPGPAERAELLRVSRMLPGLVPLVAIGRPQLSFRRLLGEGAKQWKPWVADEVGDLGKECDRCADCGQPYTTWYADNPLWNAVMRPDGEQGPEPFLCASCFLIRAEPFLPGGTARVTVARPWRPEHNTEDLGLVFTPPTCDPNALTGTCRWDHDHTEERR